MKLRNIHVLLHSIPHCFKRWIFYSYLSSGLYTHSSNSQIIPYKECEGLCAFEGSEMTVLLKMISKIFFKNNLHWGEGLQSTACCHVGRDTPHQGGNLHLVTDNAKYLCLGLVTFLIMKYLRILWFCLNVLFIFLPTCSHFCFLAANIFVVFSFAAHFLIHLIIPFIE